MRWPRVLSLLLFPVVLLASGVVLSFPEPKNFPPDESTLDSIKTRKAKLASAIAALKRQGVRDPALADIEIYHKAAEWIVKHNEFYHKDAARWTLAVLDRGLLRASQQARGETPWYSQVGQTIARAYRSRIDGSVQPYAVTYPHDYGKNRRKSWRVDVVLHGRDGGLTEVKFLNAHNGAKPVPKDHATVQIDIYGRGNNAYRWAGETDVWEVVDHFMAVETVLGRANLIDSSRVILRGFSMGGAGTWHLGLHRPDQFCVLGPGAGFTTTKGYTKLPKLRPEQEACLHIYDAVDYAENVFNVPVVAYSGADDAQKAAADNIAAKLKTLGLSMTHLVAPKLKHTFPAEWQKKAEAEYAKHLTKGRPEYPEKVRFVTYTMKYAACQWVELMGLEKHYTQARIEAQKVEGGFTVKTANIRAVRLSLWPGATREELNVTIDGQKLIGIKPHQSRTSELNVYLEKRGAKWASVLPERLAVDRIRRPQKVPNLQGPIDDAFTEGFLCVRGTGKPWHDLTNARARHELKRFQAEWSKYLRGDLPLKDDSDVTAEDIAGKHLILFGDPSSNSLIKQVIADLPLQWTKKDLTFAGKTYDASSHLPVLIYPSPLATNRYVVLNSGHTFGADDFKGTNALLYPRLGDHAIVKVSKNDGSVVEVVMAGLFDDFWRLPTKK